MFRVQQHLVSHGELHVPSVSVKLSLAPVLPLRQQRPHSRGRFGRHAAHTGRSGLAGPGRVGRVLRHGNRIMIMINMMINMTRMPVA